MRYRTFVMLQLFIITYLINGCAVIPTKITSSTESKRKIAIFFDGTANDETANTNIKKLHSLVSLQARNDISTIYIEGVGAKDKVIGMATGWGIGNRVKLAYSYLLSEYRPGDEIYIFGFSRGSYSSRILASLLYYAGVPDSKSFSKDDLADVVYDAFKGEGKDRRGRIERLFDTNGLGKATPVHVKVMGLWDTVEALGLPDYKENIDMPNGRYGDQLCNIDKAFHAMSLDDDRARIFTPILLTRTHLLDDCEELKTNLRDLNSKGHYIDSVVDEVWFSGAHADVGGGYSDSQLSGASLNWMINKLSVTGLTPEKAAVREDIYGKSHDPESGFPWALLYKKMHRNLWNYTNSEGTVYNKKEIKIHSSSIKRLTTCNNEDCKHREHEYQWSDNWGEKCFKKTEFGYSFTNNPANNCFITVVD